MRFDSITYSEVRVSNKHVVVEDVHGAREELILGRVVSFGSQVRFLGERRNGGVVELH
jgi:hypothetical protein